MKAKTYLVVPYIVY